MTDLAGGGKSIKRRLAGLRARLAHIVLLPDLSPDEAHDLRANVREDGALTPGYVLMTILSAGIATLGLLQSSVAVVIGAMLISPLMGPIAALGFAFASLDGRRIREAVRVVAVGAAIGIVTGVLLTWASPIRNATPEIIGRTQPNLLDLAIALLSGIAGGYATVRGRGATAIGVAIATALMPPLATVGYGIGVFRADFAVGALLLFLTNLAAISFSFAVIARLSGAAKPIGRVQLTPGYIVVGVVAFLALATPLALTLVRVAHEDKARNTARAILIADLGVTAANIAQLDVKWPLRGQPSVDAIVIAPRFQIGAQVRVAAALSKMLGMPTDLNLQQVVAANIDLQTKAMIDAAMERNAAGIAKDVPPYADIENALRLPVQSLWVDRASRTVNLSLPAAPGWVLADYREVERQAQANAGGWEVHVNPPFEERLTIAFAKNSDGVDSMSPATLDDMLWAIKRWGLGQVRLQGFANGVAASAATKLAQSRIAQIKDLLEKSGTQVADVAIVSQRSHVDHVDILVSEPSPSQIAAQTRQPGGSPTAPPPN